jgi:hypothetical protein
MEAVAASREHLIAMLPRPPIRSRKYPKRGKKPGKPLGLRRTTSPCPDEKEKKNSLKMSDQCGDVNENKGSAFNERRESGNIAENKGSYALKAGMLLKTSMLAVACVKEKPQSLWRTRLCATGYGVPLKSWTMFTNATTFS